MSVRISRRSIFLIVCDFLSIVLALVISVGFHSGSFEVFLHRFPYFYTYIFIFIPLFYVFDLYFPYKYYAPLQTFVDILIAASLAGVIVATQAFVDRTFAMPRIIYVISTGLIILFVFTTRLIYDRLLSGRIAKKRTLILGAWPVAYEVANLIRDTPYSEMEVVGMASEKFPAPTGKKTGPPVLGSCLDILKIVDEHKIDFVIFALDPQKDDQETEIMSKLLQRNVGITSAIRIFERLSGEFPIQLAGTGYVVSLMAGVKRMPYLKIKRMIDVVFSFCLLLVLGPFCAMAAMVLAFSGPDKIFFIQDRMGAGGKKFKLLKLRSMTADKEGKPTVTKFGRIIRKYRVDEIPQLINVLKGDMSLIGPRPEIEYFVERCRKNIPFYDAVFTLKPGLTGWAQVKFRHTTTPKDYALKFRYNLFYINNLSLTLDLLILMKTIRVVLLGKGV